MTTTANVMTDQYAPRGCEAKAAHRSRKKAHAEAVRLSNAGLGRLREYECLVCTLWHVGHDYWARGRRPTS